MSVSLVGGVRHPKIYAYSVDAFKKSKWVGGRVGVGLIKVGYTTRDVDVRIREQLQAIKMPEATQYKVLFSEAALTADGCVFDDREVHRLLVRAGVHRREGEWFECTADEVRAVFDSLERGNAMGSLRPLSNFVLRPEQVAAVEQTSKYFKKLTDKENPPHFLWNAKMRFGKTFTSYQLAKTLGWTRILVLTYKPAVEVAWREDLESHVDFQGWRFKGKNDAKPDLGITSPLVWFASFQDVLGTDDDGNPKVRNLGLYEDEWDAVIIDEYHFGAWRDAARAIYLRDSEDDLEGDVSEKTEVETPDLDDGFAETLEEALQLVVHNYLYLSGTPFRALTQGEFLENQVFNWTYSDEQRAKTNWVEPPVNPYAALPKMLLLAYEMPEKLREIALNNNSEFSLTEFFRTKRAENKTPYFIHEEEVQKWLDLLRGQDINGLWANVANRGAPPLPYENINLLEALQHTLWYMPNVDSCFAMKGLLMAQRNIFFREYEVVVAAGNKAGIGEKALPPVRKAIGGIPQDSKSITLSCGKLMTGVTVPAWGGIFMLRELKSPESYFQAAFRVQSPWVSKVMNTIEGGQKELIHKEQCYVFDFSPNRALTQIVDYATRLRTEVASERENETAIAEFMEFLPVLSFDGSSMSQLHAGDVIDFLTRGVSSGMLARRWNSRELITLDLRAMEAILGNTELLASLEKVELFRNISNDLTTMISSHKELQAKKITKEKPTPGEVTKRDEVAKRREDLRDKLQRFVTRIPAFMYLTDEREKTIKDVITQIEPDLFETVTGLSVKNFKDLVDAHVFNDSKMDDAIWKFRSFEEPSLDYGFGKSQPKTLGGWNVRKDIRFAALIEKKAIAPGDVLKSTNPEFEVVGQVSDDFGLSIDGIRYESPESAASAVTGNDQTDGWQFWEIQTSTGLKTLTEIEGSI